MSRPVSARFEPLLGTVVEVRALLADGVEQEGTDIPDLVAAEVRRLERILSVYDPTSELCRWKQGALDACSHELTEVLRLALSWQELSGGAFNVATRAVTDVWRGAERDGRLPDDAELDAAAAAIRSAPYRISGGAPVRVADCGAVDLNAVAKGWIVDQAIGIAAPWCTEVVVNAGGDLAHRGVDGVPIGVEDPHRPYDNVAPLDTILLRDAAIATSGTARRGVRIAGRRHGHVLDPRTGRPSDAVASVSVVAVDAATADALATVIGVTAATDVEGALALAETHCAAVHLVLADRSRIANEAWREHRVSPR